MVIERGEESSPVRAYVTTDQTGDLGYIPITRAMSKPAIRQKVLETALAELKDWQKRYQELKELAGVFAAIERIGRRLNLAG